MDKKDFLKFTRQFALMGQEVQNTVFDKDMHLMHLLTRVVFNKWYTELLQENLKVVPDSEGTISKKPELKKNAANPNSDATYQDTK